MEIDDLANQNILLNPLNAGDKPEKTSQIRSNIINLSPASLPQTNEPSHIGFIEEQKQKVMTSIMSSATDKITQGCCGCCSCFNFVNILQPYFEVKNMDIFERLKTSVIPMNKTFYTTASQSPDLYGPFWISTTLIFVIAAVGTINKYFNVSFIF